MYKILQILCFLKVSSNTGCFLFEKIEEGIFDRLANNVCVFVNDLRNSEFFGELSSLFG